MDSESTVAVPLSLEQRAEKADEMARLVTLISGIEDDKAAYVKKRNEEIKEHQAELEALAEEVREGAQVQSQMDLFVGEDAAKQALAEVAKRSCSCEGGPESDVKSPACPAHGVEGESAHAARQELEAGAGDQALADEVAAAASTAPPSNVVSIAEALRANEVNVGTVEEPAAVKAERAKRGRP